MRIEFWRTLEPQRGGHIMLLPQIDVFPPAIYDRKQLIVHVGWLAWRVGFFGATKMQRDLKQANKRRKASYRPGVAQDDFPPDCVDGRCLKCRRCYSEYVEAKMAGVLD